MNSEFASPSLGGVTGVWENCEGFWLSVKRSGSVSVNGQHLHVQTRASLDEPGRDAANHPSPPAQAAKQSTQTQQAALGPCAVLAVFCWAGLGDERRSAGKARTWEGGAAAEGGKDGNNESWDLP